MKNKKEDITPYNINYKPHGKWVTYHTNDKLWFKGSYINGERDGDWIHYDVNGQLYYKGSYINGNRVGMWLEWNSFTKEYDNVFYG